MASVTSLGFPKPDGLDPFQTAVDISNLADAINGFITDKFPGIELSSSSFVKMVFSTKSQMIEYDGTKIKGQQAVVVDDSTLENNGNYFWDESNWVKENTWCAAYITEQTTVGTNKDVPLVIEAQDGAEWTNGEQNLSEWSIVVPSDGLYLLSGMSFAAKSSGTVWVDVGFQTHDLDGSNHSPISRSVLPANTNDVGVSIPPVVTRITAGTCVNLYYNFEGDAPAPAQARLNIFRIGS